jgi:hypothetical protein
MKAEIELEKFGDCVELVFDYEYESAEPWHGLRESFTFYPDYLTRFDEHTGDPLLPEKAGDLVITDFIYNQLANAARSTWEG